MDEDTTDAAWAAQEFEEHRRINREYVEWLKDEFPNWFLHSHEPEPKLEHEHE